jgi:tungstate transport system ATP-binding protein
MQRVAIARAIVSEPELLLLDEPTANLDPASASRTETLITDIIHQYNTTVIMATHDMSQGQRLADRVGVLLNGEIPQTGDWREVFNSPLNKEVANFVGVENIIDGVISSKQEEITLINAGGNTIEAISDYPIGEEVCVCLRPEDITVARTKISSSARNSFAGEITRIVSFGALRRVEVDCGFPLVALVTKRSAEELDLSKGKQVYVSFKVTAIHIIKR